MQGALRGLTLNSINIAYAAEIRKSITKVYKPVAVNELKCHHIAISGIR